MGRIFYISGWTAGTDVDRGGGGSTALGIGIRRWSCPLCIASACTTRLKAGETHRFKCKGLLQTKVPQYFPVKNENTRFKLGGSLNTMDLKTIAQRRWATRQAKLNVVHGRCLCKASRLARIWHFILTCLCGAVPVRCSR